MAVPSECAKKKSYQAIPSSVGAANLLLSVKTETLKDF